MVNYFNDFANLCFERFGNRVKYWITFNNPWVCLPLRWILTCLLENQWDIICSSVQSVAVEGYETGEHAPGLKLRGTGAYRATHHIIKVGEKNVNSCKPRFTSWSDHMALWFSQAHAKVWHSYDMQWRGKQKGKQGQGWGGVTCWFLCVGVDSYCSRLQV